MSHFHREAECAAFRRAGEAVAAAELAVPFKSVESGRVAWSVPAPTSESERLDREQKAQLVWLAGLVAEQKFATGGPIDARSFVEACRQTSHEASQLADRCLAWIANPQPWAAICEVAGQLLEHRTLTAAAVRNAVAAAE